MLGSCVLVSRVRNVDVATDVLGAMFRVQESGFKVHSRSLLKKKWSDARAAWNFWISRARRVNKTEDSDSVMAILISTKPYPKDCWGGSWSHRSHVLPLH